MAPHRSPSPAALQRFSHVCDAGCGRAHNRDGCPTALLLLHLALTAGGECMPLPPRVTLSAPATMRYADLLGALTVVRARGVRQARVVVQYPSLPFPA